MGSFNLSYWALKHKAFTLFLMIASLVGGVLCYTQLGRSEDPQFKVPGLSIMVVWPGATALEMEEQVLNKIENRLQELPSYNYVNSFSRQGYGGILLQMKGGQSPEELNEAWYQVRKKINDMRHTLPKGVLDPIINDEFSDIYSVVFALKAPDLSYPELELQAENIKKALQETTNVQKVDIFGSQAEKIFVDFSHQKLASLNLSPMQLIDAIDQSNTIVPAGTYTTNQDSVQINVANSYANVQDVANTRVRLPSMQPSQAGNSVRLGDIAKVYSGIADPAEYIARHNQQHVVLIALTMAPKSNVLKFNDSVNHEADKVIHALPVGIELIKIADQPKVVKESVWEFEKSFLEALAIVLVVSFITLGIRTGWVVSISIPLVLAIVAIIMFAMEWDLNRVTLGALIIALGLLVDDAIIAAEMMLVKIEQGWDKVRAASYAYTVTAFPMLTGTLITIAGFMPVGFAKSNAGQYAGGIFWVVGTALIVSWFVAVLFTPLVGSWLLKAPKHIHPDPYDGRYYHKFKQMLEWAVSRKGLVLGLTFALFMLSIVGMKMVPQQFFPTASRPELHVTLRLPQGASIVATEREVKRLEPILAKDKDILFFTAHIGKSAPRYFLSSMPELPNPGYAQIVVLTKDMNARERVRTRLQAMFADGRSFPNTFARVERLEFGPPVKYPISFKVVGQDPDTVRGIAYQVSAVMKANKLVQDVLLEWDNKVRQVELTINEQKAAELGLTKRDIALSLQAAVSGYNATFIPKNETQIDVMVRADSAERGNIDQLKQLKLFSSTGAVVPLSAVAAIDYSFTDPILWRLNRNTFIAVSADPVDGVQAPFASSAIDKQLANIRADLPTGYTVEMAGAIEESNTSNMAIAAVFPMMLLAIGFFLMMQLHSFSKAWMVFMTAPLGIIGVVPALLISGSPFGFVALIGVIALAGMIMRNSVILVEQISHDIGEGSTVYHAVIDATIRRARPVVVTAATAMLAMLPLSASVFWGPMAIAIMGGLFIGTLLTLFFVPALFAAWYKVSKNQPNGTFVLPS